MSPGTFAVIGWFMMGIGGASLAGSFLSAHDYGKALTASLCCLGFFLMATAHVVASHRAKESA